MAKHRSLAALTLTMLFAPAAVAHGPGDAHMHGWSDGMLHPLTGLDHLAAMLGVGLWAAMRPGAGMWLVPAGFVSGMAAGLFSGLPAPINAIEGGVILSLLVLGAMLILAVKLPTWAGAVAATGAGLVHGASHASEGPADTGFIAFALGALAMTAMLHAAGGFAGASLRKRAPIIAPIAGAVLAGLGLSLAAQAM